MANLLNNGQFSNSRSFNFLAKILYSQNMPAVVRPDLYFYKIYFAFGILQKLIINNDELFGRVVEVLRSGRQVTIPVKGYSMLPFIRGEKDLVVLEPVCGGSVNDAESVDSDLRKGDIVLFHYSGRYILHRVVAIDGDSVEIQGDGVVRNREHCDLQHIYGRVVKILRCGEKAVNPYSAWQKFLLWWWNLLLPGRRYLLAVYRRLPWNLDL